MRVVTSGMMVLLVGCGAEGGIWKNASDLEGVGLAGYIGEYSANTHDGWGVAKTWNDSMLRREGFSVDVRGEGDGVIMTRVKIKGVQYADLQPGDQFDLTSGMDNDSGVRVSLLGCGGTQENAWAVDLMSGGGSLEVLSRNDTSLTLYVDVLFDDPDGSWVDTRLTLPGDLGNNAIEDQM